jgi:transcriptional regulator with XRE-family HTH domain
MPLAGRVQARSVLRVPDYDYRRRVGARIRAARKAASLTQHALAGRLDVQDVQISRWETGRTMPSPRYLDALEKALAVPAETFLRDNESG